MDLFAKVVTLEGGYSSDEKKIRRSGYQIGDMFEVESIDMGQSYTTIYDAKDGNGYNSVYFEFYDEYGVEVDIYNDPLYNPYIGLLED